MSKAKAFSEKIDKKIDVRLFSTFLVLSHYYHVFGRFSVRGVQKHGL
jgi:hypothetical protein